MATTIRRKPAAVNLVPHPGIPSGPPVAPTRVALRPARRTFGQGLGERYPVYTSPVSLEDMAYWERESRRDEDLMIDRLGREYEAQCRLEQGLDA